jgi:HAD superfamily hydrolase (TIGR01549 family)
MKTKAILFDFDGTLVHSVDLLVSIFEEILAENNFPLVSSDEIRKLIGEPLDEIFRKITPATEFTELEKTFRQKELGKNNSTHIEIVQETVPTLEFLKQAGLQLGVVSTKRVEVVLALAKEYGLEKFFDLIVGRDLITHPKPHPEPILYACEQLKIKPQETLFVGDSLLDLKSAKAAKAPFVGVLTGVCSQGDFEEHRADYIFSHVGELVNLCRRIK